MITWLYTIARNEEMLLPYFLRHYENLVDRIILYDHYSTDATTRIAEAHPSVEVRPFTLYGKVDEVLLTEFINNQYKEALSKADWVMWVDVDEFLYHPMMVDYLADMLVRGVSVIRTTGYTMMSNHTPNGGVLTSQIKTGVPDGIFGKWAIFSPWVDIGYLPGRHRAQPKGPGKLSPTAEVKLLHYRYFGAEWLARRNAEQYANLSERNKLNGWGYNKAAHAIGYYSPGWFVEKMAEAVEVV